MSTASKRRHIWVVISLLGLILGFSAMGAENIQIPTDNLKVYSRSDMASPVIGILHKGSVVPAANQPIGNFRKVMINVNGEKKIGFINLYDIKGPLTVVPPPTPPAISGIQHPPSPPRMVRRRADPYQGLHNKSFIGLFGGVEYESQGARIYTDASGIPINVGTLSGASTEFGIEYGFPLSYNFSLVPYLIYKPISVTGTAAPTGSNTTSSTIVLTQTFLSFGILGKKYMSDRSSWWWGGGLQNDYGISGTLQIGSASAISQGSLPDFIMMYLATGYDFGITKKLFLIPDVRVGGLINTSPIILAVDVNLGLAYMF